MLRRNRKALALVVAFVCALVFAAVAVQAASEGGKVVLTRPGHPSAGKKAIERFGNAEPGRGLSCSGWCNAMVCECYGSYDCCVAGCTFCWSVLDQ